MIEVNSKIFRSLLSITLALGLCANNAQCATRTIYFVGFVQSHMTLEVNSNAAPSVGLTCNVYIQNVSSRAAGGGTPPNQYVKSVTINFKAATTSTQNANYFNDSGPAGAPQLTFYTLDTRAGSAAKTVVSTPTSGSPQILLPFQTGADTLHVRGAIMVRNNGMYMSGFPPAVTFPTANLNVMHQCSGQIVVSDTASGSPGSSPGAVIATGSLESVADSDSNPTITYGT